MLAAIKRYPHTVRLLLLTTFTLTVARALTLPYLVVYLADNFQLPISQIGLLIGGVLVGLGTRYANGCTSGHGICGLSRFSLRSLVAVLSFMGSAMVTVYVLRHLLGGVV